MLHSILTNLQTLIFSCQQTFAICDPKIDAYFENSTDSDGRCLDAIRKHNRGDFHYAESFISKNANQNLRFSNRNFYALQLKLEFELKLLNGDFSSIPNILNSIKRYCSQFRYLYSKIQYHILYCEPQMVKINLRLLDDIVSKEIGGKISFESFL